MRALCIPMSGPPVKRTRSVGLVSGQGCAQGQEALCRARVRTRSSTPCRNQGMRKVDAEGSFLIPFVLRIAHKVRTRSRTRSRMARGSPRPPRPTAGVGTRCEHLRCILVRAAVYYSVQCYCCVYWCVLLWTNIRAQSQGH